MADTKQRASGGVGFLGLFFLVLFTLKVTGPLAGVSWWWITAPLWGIPAVLLGLAALVGVIAAGCFTYGALVGYVKGRWNR